MQPFRIDLRFIPAAEVEPYDGQDRYVDDEGRYWLKSEQFPEPTTSKWYYIGKVGGQDAWMWRGDVLQPLMWRIDMIRIPGSEIYDGLDRYQDEFGYQKLYSQVTWSNWEYLGISDGADSWMKSSDLYSLVSAYWKLDIPFANWITLLSATPVKL